MTARMPQSAPSPGNTRGEGRQKKEAGRQIRISNVQESHHCKKCPPPPWNKITAYKRKRRGGDSA